MNKETEILRAPAVAWSWFAVVQLVQLAAQLAGLVLLVPFCLAQAWVDCPSTLEKGRTIDAWIWAPLNCIYGNREDGVSGIGARIWNVGGTARVPYMPAAWAPWRAYCWSALRNSTGGLKYVFAWERGPFWQGTVGGRKVKLGWQEEVLGKVPVLSIR